VREGAVIVTDVGLTATIDGVVYRVGGSFDLTDFDAPLVEQVPALAVGMPVLNPGWSYRTFRLVEAVVDRSTGFVRLVMAEAGE